MVLSIETSTDVCSVALHNNQSSIGSLKSSEAYSHAEKLAPMIEQLLNETGIERSALTAVAISSGPGSYTGLRIGTSTAKGLCYALDIPLIAVNTLESMLINIPEQYADLHKCPMIDARRMEVYCLLADAASSIIEPTHAKIIDSTSFKAHLDKYETVFFGNGAMKCEPIINNSKAIFVDGIEPSAINIGYLALDKYTNGDFEDLAYFEPEYLKPFHAIKPKKLL